MRPTSQAYKDAIKQTQDVSVSVEILTAGTHAAWLTGESGVAALTDGSVTLDAKAASRGRFTLSVVDDGSLGLVPINATSLLSQYGNEVRIRRGLTLPDGTVEAPSIAVCRIDQYTVQATPGSNVITISGLDRSGRIMDARFEEPVQIAAGTNVETAILAVIAPGFPAVESVMPGVTFTTPLLTAAEGDDRWKLAQDIATACGLELFFDGDGRLRLQPLPAGNAVAALVEGAGGVLLTAEKTGTREGTFNRWIVTGENTGESAPVRGVATDTNPLSPTYYDGPFGRKPGFFVSQFVTTAAQALAAATTMLARQMGTTQTVNFGAVVDPSLEPGDVVRITRASAGIDEDHTIETVTIPLTADQEMAGSTRATQALV
jgi:hypothetical protein